MRLSIQVLASKIMKGIKMRAEKLILRQKSPFKVEKCKGISIKENINIKHNSELRYKTDNYIYSYIILDIYVADASYCTIG